MDSDASASRYRNLEIGGDLEGGGRGDFREVSAGPKKIERRSTS